MTFKLKVSGAVVFTLQLLSSVTHVSASTTALPSGAILVNLTRDSDYSAYLAQFHPGTPAQSEYVKVDTGSPTYSFLNPRNKYCQQPDTPCAQYGTYNNLTSRTSHYAGSGFSDELIDFGSGDFINDTVIIGGTTVKHLQFGYIDSYPFSDQVAYPTTTICGFSVQCDSRELDESCYYEGPYLLPQLYNASAINRRVVSFYFGPEEPHVSNSQMILGGAYDKAKMKGTPFTVPMTVYNGGSNAVNVTAMSAITSHNTTRVAIGQPGVGQTVLIDTGNPVWNLPQSIFNIVYAAFGKPTQQNQETGAYTVDCKYRNLTTGSILSEFGKYGSISVPFSSLVTSYGNGTCVSFIGNGGPVSQGVSPFADPFLRNTYSIFDQDKFTITFAQAQFTDKQEIVALPNNGF